MNLNLFDRSMPALDWLVYRRSSSQMTGGPTCVVERLDRDRYRITMAVAGFGQNEIDVIQEQNALIITGQKALAAETSQVLYRGIATEPFRQVFYLPDHVNVTEAALQNGLLPLPPDASCPRR
jgi:molecular chaperone IbpA